MESDKTRTRRGGSGRLDDFGRQLNALAGVGLTRTAIEDRQRRVADLGLLLGLASEQESIRQQADAVIDLVVDACRRLRVQDERYGNCAIELFGVRPGERGLPYAERHARAADAWRPGLLPASFDRRHRVKVINELQAVMLALKADSGRAHFRRYLSELPELVPLPEGDNRPNLSFKRLNFRAVTHIVGDSRRPKFTDWHYHDVATRGDEQYFRIYTKAEGRVEIESLSDNIDVERPLGIDPYGYQVWLVRFHEIPRYGQDFEWSVRKWFHNEDVEEPTTDWISLATSQPRPLESSLFEVDLTEARHKPGRFAKFVTPKQTLPNPTRAVLALGDEEPTGVCLF